MFVRYSVIVCLTATAACAPNAARVATQAPAPASGYSAGFQRKGHGNAERLSTNDPARAPRLSQRGVVSFTQPDAAAPALGLKVEVSKDRSGLAFEDRLVVPAMISGNNFLVRLGDIPGEIDHAHYVKFVVHDPTDNTDREYWVRYQKRVTWWNGITSPVLYKFDGNVSGFGLVNFAPSLAAGPRVNFESKSDSYFGINGLLTVYKAADATGSGDRPYSAALGAIGDVSGIFQFGGTYHFKDKKWALVIGVRPEVLSHLGGD